MTTATAPTYDVEQAVRTRYSQGSQRREASLCCPASYDSKYLAALPREIIDLDYGCGDPTRWIKAGETVVDLGSGSGKTCYVLSQVVGPDGRVIGVDMNDDMLTLARRHQPQVSDAIGHNNVRFVKGRIQDLALDLDKAQAWLATHPIKTVEGLAAFEAQCAQLRREQPLIADGSIDVVVSSCVLNLVQTRQKEALFAEIFRVLRQGGRAVISDIVCDEDPTPAIMNDPELWSGCIAGAFREDAFLRMFEDAGFHGIEILARGERPWRTIDGIEFRSMTVRAFKGKQGPCMERNQAVVYLGPWKQVKDDDGHVFPRGQRMAVCDKTFKIMMDHAGPYVGQMAAVEPLTNIPLAEATPFDCRRSVQRHPRETKGMEYRATTAVDPNACCGPNGCC